MIYCLDTDILIEHFRGNVLINDADIMTASIVKAHHAVLVTNNLDHFSRIEALKTENWLK